MAAASSGGRAPPLGSGSSFAATGAKLSRNAYEYHGDWAQVLALEVDLRSDLMASVVRSFLRRSDSPRAARNRASLASDVSLRGRGGGGRGEGRALSWQVGHVGRAESMPASGIPSHGSAACLSPTRAVLRPSCVAGAGGLRLSGLRPLHRLAGREGGRGRGKGEAAAGGL